MKSHLKYSECPFIHAVTPKIQRMCIHSCSHTWNTESVPSFMQSHLEYRECPFIHAVTPGIQRVSIHSCSHTWNTESVHSFMQSYLEYRECPFTFMQSYLEYRECPFIHAVIPGIQRLSIHSCSHTWNTQSVHSFMQSHLQVLLTND